MDEPLSFQTSTQTKTAIAPGERWAQTDSPSLKKTRLGLLLLFYGILISVICLIVMAFLNYALVGIVSKENGFNIVVPTALLMIVSVSFLYFAVPIFCLAVPAESGAKGLLAGSIMLNFISMVNSIVQFIMPTIVPSIVFHIIGICGGIGMVVFILFLKKLSEYIGREDLAAMSSKVLLFTCICWAITLGIFTFTLPYLVEFLLFILAALASIYLFFISMSLLNGLINALGKVDNLETS
jgi:hypothetical protein